MSIFNHYGTETAREREGIERQISPQGWVKIRRAGGANAAFAAAQRRIYAPHQSQIDAGTIEPEQMRRLNARLYAEAVLVGWRGDDFEPVGPYTIENAERLLIDLPDLLTQVWSIASAMQSFQDRDKRDEGALGNG